jgi:S1-C subfamily serine protease
MPNVRMRLRSRSLVLASIGLAGSILALAANAFGGQALSADEREALERGCRQQSWTNPAGYYRCLEDTVDRLNRGGAGVQLDALTPVQREQVRLACLGSKNQGLIAYDECLRRQLPAAANDHSPGPGPQPSIARREEGKQGNLDPSQVFAVTSPSVYFVVSGDASSRYASIGSAVAVSGRELLTNCHVVSQNANILISDGASPPWSARVRYADQEGDRCVLESLQRVRAVPGIGAYVDLQVGERVYTIGNPSGLVRTLSEGLISGLRRRQGLKLVQTSAAISPGSSGGGLFDGRGRLIGITTFLVSDLGNLGFAIAADEFMLLPVFGNKN